MIRRSLLPLILVCLCCNLGQASWSLSWVVRGTVVAKSFRPRTFQDSLGEGGVYKLQIRDEHNKVRGQLVSPEIYRGYQIGDLFDSSAPMPKRKSPPHSKKIGVSQPEVRPATSERLYPVSTLAVRETKKRLASTYFTPDMLPETEGF